MSHLKRMMSALQSVTVSAEGIVLHTRGTGETFFAAPAKKPVLQNADDKQEKRARAMCAACRLRQAARAAHR